MGLQKGKLKMMAGGNRQVHGWARGVLELPRRGVGYSMSALQPHPLASKTPKTTTRVNPRAKSTNPVNGLVEFF